jgi:hypothetical protein
VIAEILANAVGGILSEVLGTVLRQPLKRMFDEHDLQRSLTAAVKSAEERFARYSGQEVKLFFALMHLESDAVVQTSCLSTTKPLWHCY